MDIEKIMDAIGSDKAFYAGLRFFGIICFIGGFFNPLHWALSAGCFAGMLFMGNPQSKQSINNKN